MSIDGTARTCTYCHRHIDTCICPKRDYRNPYESVAFDAGVEAAEGSIVA